MENEALSDKKRISECLFILGCKKKRYFLAQNCWNRFIRYFFVQYITHNVRGRFGGLRCIFLNTSQLHQRLDSENVTIRPKRKSNQTFHIDAFTIN